jgi:hypothetical protein
MSMKPIRILLLTLMLNVLALAQPHDGRWWETTRRDQINEYLNGYMDCAVYDAGRRDLPSVSTVEIGGAIQDFYDSHPGKLNFSIAKVLDIVSAKKSLHHAPPPGGEVWTNKHGYYDGEYWPISDVERTGFVQGLRDCYRSLSSGPQFSRSDAYYVQKITAWYDNPKHSHKYRTSIAVVLTLYADKKLDSNQSQD